jgi:hypothetical protein
VACPDASRGWILIDLLEDGGLDLGCGDDHIPIIDCMKIFCTEGKKERLLDYSSVSDENVLSSELR